MTIYLYVKTHLVTGKKYLGKTRKNPYKYKGSGIDWKKHLLANGNDVATEVIRECDTLGELTKWGRYYSDEFNVVNSPEFLNRIPETGGGGELSEETRKKISEAGKGRVSWNKGKTTSVETRKKMSEAGKGKILSVETRKKLSEANMGKILSVETRKKMSEAGKSKKHSDETRKKISEAKMGKVSGMKGKKHSDETRKKMSEARKGKNLGKVSWNNDKRDKK